jgi:hypothetical protein
MKPTFEDERLDCHRRLETPGTSVELAVPPPALRNQPYDGGSDPLDCEFPENTGSIRTEVDFT